MDFVHGVATIGLEIYEQCSNLDVIFVPIGGGGLASGLGLLYENLRKDGRPQIIGVQPSRSRPIYEYFHYGKILSKPRPTTASCLEGEPESGAIILESGRRILSDIVIISEDDIHRATATLTSRNVFVEPGAAAGYAAYLRYGSGDNHTGIVLTGTI
jgi:threonine dehydratase